MLELRNVTSAILKKPISFKLYPGEALGIAGLKGSGRTELFHILFGLDKLTGGEILLGGKKLTLRQPRDAVKSGIFLIPENRQTQGLSLEHSIYRNVTLPWLEKLRTGGPLISDAKGKKLSLDLLKNLQVKFDRQEAPVQSLSGGNQQKVVIAKSLASLPDILIFDEPTRGIDIGARYEIYQLMIELTRQGKSILMVSSDMEELLGMSERIVVLHEGEQTGTIEKPDFSQERVLALASGFNG